MCFLSKIHVFFTYLSVFFVSSANSYLNVLKCILTYFDVFSRCTQIHSNTSRYIQIRRISMTAGDTIRYVQIRLRYIVSRRLRKIRLDTLGYAEIHRISKAATDTRGYVQDTSRYERIERISGRWPQVYLPAIPSWSMRSSSSSLESGSR